jgi:hypothetical protein
MKQGDVLLLQHCIVFLLQLHQAKEFGRAVYVRIRIC